MFTGWRGDHCPLCNGPIKRTATHWGLCAQHWLGATPTERALAAFDHYWNGEEDRMLLELRADLEAYGKQPYA